MNKSEILDLIEAIRTDKIPYLEGWDKFLHDKPGLEVILEILQEAMNKKDTLPVSLLTTYLQFQVEEKHYPFLFELIKSRLAHTGLIEEIIGWMTGLNPSPQTLNIVTDIALMQHWGDDFYRIQWNIAHYYVNLSNNYGVDTRPYLERMAQSDHPDIAESGQWGLDKLKAKGSNA